MRQEVGIRTNLDVLNVQQNVYSSASRPRERLLGVFSLPCCVKSSIGNLTEQEHLENGPPGRLIRGASQAHGVGGAAVRGVDAASRMRLAAQRMRAELADLLPGGRARRQP